MKWSMPFALSFKSTILGIWTWNFAGFVWVYDFWKIFNIFWSTIWLFLDPQTPVVVRSPKAWRMWFNFRENFCSSSLSRLAPGKSQKLHQFDASLGMSLSSFLARNCLNPKCLAQPHMAPGSLASSRPDKCQLGSLILTVHKHTGFFSSEKECRLLVFSL